MINLLDVLCGLLLLAVIANWTIPVIKHNRRKKPYVPETPNSYDLAAMTRKPK